MSYFEEVHEIIDPQKRLILYSHTEIIERTLQLGFPDTVPQHFVSIFTKPDTIYMDVRNNVHCYQKHMKGRMYTVSIMEVEEMGEKYFTINSWFDDRDTTISTIKKLVKAEENAKLKKKMEEKINDSKSWMKILYQNASFMQTNKYKKRGYKVVDKNGNSIVEVPERKKTKRPRR